MTPLNTIQNFLACKRLAVIGVSRQPRDFTRMMFRELRKRGYDAVPVNPNMTEVEGVGCYASVADIPQPVEAALVMTNAGAAEGVVQDCARAGVRQVWLYRAGGTGAATAEAIRACERDHIACVAGECPYMFLPSNGLPHNVHGFCRKLLGRYPQ